MEYRDLLIVLAEIGVAFAGFGSLIVVLGEPGGSVDYTSDRSRLSGVVGNGLLTTGGAIAAFIPGLFGLELETGWRVVSGATGAFLVVYLAARLSMFRDFYVRAGELGQTSSQALVVFHVGLYVASIVLLLGVCLAVWPWGAEGGYVAALLGPALIAGNIFRRIIVRKAREEVDG